MGKLLDDAFTLEADMDREALGALGCDRGDGGVPKIGNRKGVEVHEEAHTHKREASTPLSAGGAVLVAALLAHGDAVPFSDGAGGGGEGGFGGHVATAELAVIGLEMLTEAADGEAGFFIGDWEAGGGPSADFLGGGVGFGEEASHTIW
jgi:hypothetical protein